jgi:hypothetical protein
MHRCNVERQSHLLNTVYAKEPKLKRCITVSLTDKTYPHFMHLAGELVEFEVEVDTRGPGSRTAINVTGPDGVRVKGIPRPPTRPRM